MFCFELALAAKRGRVQQAVSALVFLSLLILWPGSSLFAAEPGTFTVRGGPVVLKTKDAGGSISLNNTPVPGASLSVDDVNHYGALLTWALTRNISLETAVSTPMEIEVNLGGGAVGSEFKAAQVDAIPLILIGRYAPEKDWYGFRPYVGVGAAYIMFDNKKTTAAFDKLAEGMLGLSNPKIEVDDQLRPVVELGLDYLIGENWFVNASWFYLEGDDKVKVTYSNGAELVSHVSYEPQMFALTLGYQF